MNYITVPHTCPYIDDVLQMLETIYDELEPLDREYGSPISSARSTAMNATNIMEDIRSMNSELRDEGEVASEAAETFEGQKDEIQDMLAHAEERIMDLEKELFDVENDKKEEEWRQFLSIQESLLIGSS